ncbi:amino acid permease [Streptomyces sp. NPDC006476]|uniref:amino acid permease n=1 Tax=Streptomyces sp. NPDC006476 TaxID=3157175 RepID=UPI0033A73BA6
MANGTDRGAGLADVIAVGALIGILTVMFTFMLGVTRVWFSMSRDGLPPKWFAKTHPTRHVPQAVGVRGRRGSRGADR